MKFTLTPVAGDYFVGRERLLDELTKELGDVESTIGFCIYGMRRVGKTSILRELERRLNEKEKTVVVYFSLWDLDRLSTKTLAEELSETIISAYQERGLLKLEMTAKRLAEGTRDVAARLVTKSKVGVRVEDVEFFLTIGERRIDNYSHIIRRAFNLSEKLAEKTDTKCVLMIDEFPDILKLTNGLQLVKMLRTTHESHKHVGLVISGSSRSTIEQVAISDASPFYRQLILKRIEPLNVEEVQKFLRKYANIRSKELAEKLVEMTGGVPFYLQCLGRTVADLKHVDGAVKEFLYEEGGVIFQEYYKGFNETEKAIVSVIAKGSDRFSEIAKRAGLPVTSVPTYINQLIDKDVVQKVEKGKYVLLDRMFARWLEDRPGTAR